MLANKLKELLDAKNIKYVVITHSPAYTSQEIAEKAHIPGKEIAKSVIAKIDNKMMMLVLPGSYKINFNLLKSELGAKKIDMASEEEFGKMFPDCELGAMPPFGEIYGLDVISAKSLSEDESIAFNAGNHKELIKMSYADFINIVNPKIIDFAHN